MPDRIEKQLILRTSVQRVWQALTDIDEFRLWFGVRLDQPFAPGQTVTGTFEHPIDEGALLRYQQSIGIDPRPVRPPSPNMVFCTVERMEAPRYFSFRWIPYGIDADCDPEHEPTTLVEFTLEAVDEGTRLTVTESGFEHVPAHRRERAFRMNDGGWAAQVDNIKRYVEQARA